MSTNAIKHNAKFLLLNAGMSALRALAGVIVLVLLAGTANADEKTTPNCDPGSCLSTQLWDTLEGDADVLGNKPLVLILAVFEDGTVVGFANPHKPQDHNADDNKKEAEVNGNVKQKIAGVGIVVTIKNPQVCWVDSSNRLHCINY